MGQAGDNLTADVLAAFVVGSSLHGRTGRGGEGGWTPDEPTLGDQLDPAGRTLVVFLRHLGCPFAREMVRDVRVAAERADSTDAGDAQRRFPRVVFVHTATARQGGRFLGRYWPASPAISDRGRRLYDAAGFARGSVLQVLGPRTWPCLLRVGRKGLLPARPVGDPWAMPGLLLLSPAGRIDFRHSFAHAGARFDYTRFAGRLVPGDAAKNDRPPAALSFGTAG